MAKTMTRDVALLLGSALAFVAGCGGAAVAEEGGGPCEAADLVGPWTVTYDVPAATACSPGIDDELSLTLSGDSLAFDYLGSSEGSFDPASCSIQVSSHLSWDEGGEAWWDDRELSLTFDGDRGAGTLTFDMSWNCVGTTPVEYPATATR